MAQPVSLEIGKRKIFATALEWPGWCRWGKVEEAALAAMLAYGKRYSTIAEDAGLAFTIPESTADFTIIERVPGSTTTDFGAPDAAFMGDSEPLVGADLERTNAILQACWRAFDRAVEQAHGRKLKKGPRGGGRDLEKMTLHVVESEENYVKKLGWKLGSRRDMPLEIRQKHIRQQALLGLEAASVGALDPVGPRGGKRWPARIFVRRLAWHAVDHAWEIEDRMVN